MKNLWEKASQVENRLKRTVETLENKILRILHSSNLFSVHRAEVIMTSLNAHESKQDCKRKPRKEENYCPVPKGHPNAVINNQKKRKKLR